MIGTREDWQWAVSEDAAPLRARLAPGTPVGELARLREHWPAERIAVVSEMVAATATAAMPPKPSDRIIACGKMSMPTNPQINNSAENATVRPAVDIVRRTASTVPRPPRSSSRNRVITNRL